MEEKLLTCDYLKKKGIPYDLQKFSKETEKGVINVAQKLHKDPHIFLKTLIFEGKSGKLYICLVGGDQTVNERLLLKASGEEKIGMASGEKIEKELGYKIGAIPPFGFKNKVPVFIEESMKEVETVGVGAGVWGNELFMNIQDVLKATDGAFVLLSKNENEVDLKNLFLEKKFTLRTSQIERFESSVQLRDIARYEGKEVTLYGWIFNKRSSGSIYFLQFRDGSGFIQIVAEKKSVGEKIFTLCGDITVETSVILKGKVKADKRAPSGYEITLTDLSIIQLADEYPIQKKDHGIEFLLDHRHLWLRSRKQWAIQRVRNTIINAIYEYLNKNGFIKIDAPILTPTSCEGTSTLFPVPYLPGWKTKEGGEANVYSFSMGKSDEDKPVGYLTQSGQLYIEAAIFAHGRVFDFGPVFRAEKSKTRRHLNEFWMMDAEAAFVDHVENMKIQEGLTVAIVKKVLKDNKFELSLLERDVSQLKKTTEGNFACITHKEAILKLQKLGSAIQERDDLGADDETILTEQFDRPVFIEKYPKEVKAFYMKEDPSDSSRVLNADLLAHEGYGEIIGGSQREDDYNLLLKRLLKEKLPVKDFQWYLDLRKYGSVPHSGFGIGLERYVRWICGLKHIRETIPFPRMMHRITP